MGSVSAGRSVRAGVPDEPEVRHKCEHHKHGGAADHNHQCGEQQRSDDNSCESKSGRRGYGSASRDFRKRAASSKDSGESGPERDHGGSGSSDRSGGSGESQRDGSQQGECGGRRTDECAEAPGCGSQQAGRGQGCTAASAGSIRAKATGAASQSWQATGHESRAGSTSGNASTRCACCENGSSGAGGKTSGNDSEKTPAGGLAKHGARGPPSGSGCWHPACGRWVTAIRSTASSRKSQATGYSTASRPANSSGEGQATIRAATGRRR